MLTKPRATTPGDLTAIEQTVPALRDAAARCTGCGLYKNATQTVFGEGPQGALVMLVGEQPGDAEDLAGRPFVGPAGKLLDRCVAEAGIDRAKTYVTNVVKHFKWVSRGPRRIHSKPGAVEIEACFPWLESRDTGCCAAHCRCTRSHRGPGAFWQGVPCNPRPRSVSILCARTVCARHRAPLGAATRSGRGDPTSGNWAVYRGSSPGRADLRRRG